MIWYRVAVILDLLLDVLALRCNTPDKDLEILLLRQQLQVLERQFGQRPRPSRWEKCLLAVLFVQLRQTTGQSRAQLAKIRFSSHRRCCVGIGSWSGRNGRLPRHRKRRVGLQPIQRLSS
jgi:hypothetical protein